MDIEQAKETANALLATVKKVMSGREIEACEWTRSYEFEDEVLFVEYGDADYLEYDDDGEPPTWLHDDICSKLHLLESLSIQFSREVGRWINSRNAARARKTIKV